MQLNWIGAFFIIAGCGWFGFSIASASRQEVRMLQEFLRAVNLIACELPYKLTPLPDLCRQVGNGTSGSIREIFLNLARELEWQIQPDVTSCMAEALAKSRTVPVKVRRQFFQLGTSLGRFDLSGQLKDLEFIRNTCETELEACAGNQELRQRSYRTIGLCTGAALAILFL